jgi:hypothetical protein
LANLDLSGMNRYENTARKNVKTTTAKPNIAKRFFLNRFQTIFPSDFDCSCIEKQYYCFYQYNRLIN